MSITEIWSSAWKFSPQRIVFDALRRKRPGTAIFAILDLESSNAGHLVSGERQEVFILWLGIDILNKNVDLLLDVVFL